LAFVWPLFFFVMPVALSSSSSRAAGIAIAVLTDTNQVEAALAAGIKVEWRTDLAVIVSTTHVEPVWVKAGPPVEEVNSNGVHVVRVTERLRRVTNVTERISYGGQTRDWNVSQTFSAALYTRVVEYVARMEPVLTAPRAGGERLKPEEATRKSGTQSRAPVETLPVWLRFNPPVKEQGR